MSDYKRFISYIYLYDKGNKVKNTGFAKIDSRDGQCSIYIQIKGVYISQADHAQLYLFYREKQQLLGLCIGDFVLKNGFGEHRAVLNPVFFEQAEKNLSEMAGLYIRIGKNKICATVWDDEPIYLERMKDIQLPQKTNLKAAEISEEPEDGAEQDRKKEHMFELMKETEASEAKKRQSVAKNKNSQEVPVFNQPETESFQNQKEPLTEGIENQNQTVAGQTSRQNKMTQQQMSDVQVSGRNRRIQNQTANGQKETAAETVQYSGGNPAEYVLQKEQEPKLKNEAEETEMYGGEEAASYGCREEKNQSACSMREAFPSEPVNGKTDREESGAEVTAASFQGAEARSMPSQACFQPAGEDRRNFQDMRKMRMENFGAGRNRRNWEGVNGGFPQSFGIKSGKGITDGNKINQQIQTEQPPKKEPDYEGRQEKTQVQNEAAAAFESGMGEKEQQVKRTVENMSLDEKWNLLKKKYAVVHPFENYEEMEWIRIEPKDIDQLSKEEWILGNNSFLLHGYCNYKYLILGRNLKTKVCCIGVPGVFYQKERMMANMFGFTDFRMAQGTSLRQGDFGYWWKKVTL